MQRLPSHRIQRAHELDEVDLQEYPSPAGLRSRNEAALGARANFFRVHVQEGGGFIEARVRKGGGLEPAALPARCLGMNDLVWFRSFRDKLSRTETMTEHRNRAKGSFAGGFNRSAQHRPEIYQLES